MRHHLYTDGPEKACVSFKNLQSRQQRDFGVLVLPSYFISMLVSRRETDVRYYSPLAPCFSISVSP